MGRVLGDIRYALRGLLRARGFTIPAVLTLAVGIGTSRPLFPLAIALRQE